MRAWVLKQTATRTVLGLVATLCVLAGPARAARGDAGSSAADFLRFGTSARAVAMGEAFVGVPGAVEGLQYNPASLARMDSAALYFQHNAYILDMKSNYGAVAIPGRRISVGLSVLSMDDGTFTRRTISAPGGNGTFTSASVAGTAGLAATVSDYIQVGASVKLFTEEIDSVNRDGFAFDLGLVARPRGTNQFAVGLAVRNLGAKVMRFDRLQEDLPLEFAAGFSGHFFHDRIWVTGEVASPRNQEVDYRAGLEWHIAGPIFLRGGYNSRNDLDAGWSAGAGFRYKGLRLDYAYVPFGDAGESHRVGLTWEFDSPLK